MIRLHETNTAWWGSPVGLVEDARWFDQEEIARRHDLGRFSWVEYKAALTQSPSPFLLARTGFAFVDVQINFRLSLSRLPQSPSLAPLECHSAKTHPWQLNAGEMRHFEHERFLQLPGADKARLAERYSRWANEVITRSPASCVQIIFAGRVQGWFIAEPTNAGLHLALAMLAAGSTISGHHLYHRALRFYADHGFTVGQAAFSVRNTPVMNIYAQLGARFSAPVGCWLWHSISNP